MFNEFPIVVKTLCSVCQHKDTGEYGCIKGFEAGPDVKACNAFEKLSNIQRDIKTQLTQ
jgi:hypothetical protein